MPNATCSIDGCERPRRARGWCQRHYDLWRRNGDPLMASRYETQDQAFLARLASDGDCIVYTGQKSRKGYGQISINGRLTPAHRYSWTRKNGPIPEGMQIDHICFNKACVKIAHLRLTTPQQNKSNVDGAYRTNKSTGIRNVHQDKHGKFRVELRRNGKAHYYGSFATVAEAEVVAERARQELFGKYAGRGGEHGNTAALREVHPRPAEPVTVH